LCQYIFVIYSCGVIFAKSQARWSAGQTPQGIKGVRKMLGQVQTIMQLKDQARQAIIGCLVVCVGGCALHGVGGRHRPAHSELVGEHQPGFAQGRPAQFGFLVDGELRMMKAALGLGTKCREVVTIDFGNVCHVSNFSEN
jgi:hypothetical protein